ncbi:hypothetical protein M2092_000511 [Fusobacterium sp. PH5-44]
MIRKKNIFYTVAEIALIIFVFKVLGHKSNKLITIGLISFYSLKSTHEISLISNNEHPLSNIISNFKNNLKELLIIFALFMGCLIYTRQINPHIDFSLLLILCTIIFLKSTLLMLYNSSSFSYTILIKNIFTLKKGFRLLIPAAFIFGITIYSFLFDHLNKISFMVISLGIILFYLVKKFISHQITFSKLLFITLLFVANIYMISIFIECNYILKNFPTIK